MSEKLFVTRLYKGRIAVARDLEKTCLAIAAEDRAGQRWSKSHGYGGYTSYASLNDLTRRASILADLERAIAKQVTGFVRELQFERGGRLKLDSLWINVMQKG
ncbi:MAG TPA: TIGR02466 family protein, partial [Rhizomicrobium sp.]|nr:TIGR02466 family protein [Rhizomicrobium sp.]